MRLLTGAAVAAALLALALILSARGPGSESVKAGAAPPPGQARTQASTERAGGVPAPRPSAPPASARPSAAPSARASAPTDAGPSPAAEVDPAARPTPSPRTPAAVPTPAPTADPDPPVERIEDPAGAVQVGGRWELTHDVESSNYQPFQGLRLGYRINLVQEGNRVYGQGQKVSENGVALPTGQRTPIDVAGRIENDQLVLYFTEIGQSRTSRGTIRWRLAPGSQLQGRFASDAADSSGSSSGRRLP
jgi:hypothetical protein